MKINIKQKKKIVNAKKMDYSKLKCYPFTSKELFKVKENKAILKHPMGHFCGYVVLLKHQLPKEWYDNYDADALQYLDIHGGITYVDSFKKYVIFGFDCAHAGDIKNKKLEDVDYVLDLAEVMEQQLLAYAKVIDKWRASPKDKKLKILEKIRKSSKVKSEYGFGLLIDLFSGGSKLETKEETTKRELEQLAKAKGWKKPKIYPHLIVGQLLSFGFFSSLTPIERIGFGLFIAPFSYLCWIYAKNSSGEYSPEDYLKSRHIEEKENEKEKLLKEATVKFFKKEESNKKRR